jgi:hypothetical protein
MSKIALSGNSLGTGTLTIAAPNTNTDRTLVLPDEAGTVLTNNSIGYRYVDTIYYTSSGTFAKADYPWLRAIRVRVVGGGASGGGAEITGAGVVSVGSGGSAGGYSESFITDIAGLTASVTVTRGAAGVGVVGASGAAGGSSSFGAIVTANGGNAGPLRAATAPATLIIGAVASSAGTGQVATGGEAGAIGVGLTTTFNNGGNGGSSVFGGGGAGTTFNQNGQNATGFGSAGGGGANAQNQATARSGGNGANGIVIVELYA